MVLGLIIVVSYVLTKFVERAQVEVQGEGYYVERTRLSLQAWAFLGVTVAVMMDVNAIDEGIDAVAQDCADAIDYTRDELSDGTNLTSKVIIESSKRQMTE